MKKKVKIYNIFEFFLHPLVDIYYSRSRCPEQRIKLLNVKYSENLSREERWGGGKEDAGGGHKENFECFGKMPNLKILKREINLMMFAWEFVGIKKSTTSRKHGSSFQSS